MQWIDRITMIFIRNYKVLIHVSLISVLHREEQLTMLNGEFVNDSALSLADRIRRTAGPSSAEQVECGLSIVFSRKPQPQEVQAGVRMMEEVARVGNLSPKEALDRFALLALNLNEFIYLD